MISNEEFKYEIKKIQWLQRMLNYWTMNKMNVNLEIKQWEIYEIDFGINVNSEFSGRHYGIVLFDSSINNPLISVIPLKTKKEKINKYSDVYLGKIEGINTLKESIAVINQINTFDKLRIFNKEIINKHTINSKIKLTNEQILVLKKALKKIYFNFL